MPELLTGTVTFLFSDIEGSTRLTQMLGDAWPPILARHQDLLRAAFEAEGGREAGTEGDSFFVAFPTAPGAVAAAVAAQRALAAEAWPEGAKVRVRIGLHTGEAGFSTDSYVGLHVHRASRIASAGHGGQVLLSQATRALAEQDLPDGVELRDLGEHRLKDLERPEHLWQLVIPGLLDDFPPIASLDAIPNNLPTRLTTFLGREAEIADVEVLLERSRLLTLTGPGGTGKTRLSLEVAGRALGRYPGGVFFVELAAIRDPDLVPTTIAMTLGLPDHGGRGALERLADHIADRRVLLVLDNFEQVAEAAPSVSALLAACPSLTVLTSSRSVLRVSGEQEFPVPPLRLPDPGHLPPLAQLSQFEAVALFIERARAVKPDFEVTNDNAPAVAEICVRLDGLPLALELAAARIRIFTPQAMLGRLEHRLGLLSGGMRDLPERQQTLRGAIAWSHDMLEETDRRMFACLSVFVGGAGLDAIEHVCGDVGAHPLDLLESLIEKSLVRQVEGADGEPRFAMLETIREYAVEQAVERGEWEGLRERHAALFTRIAEEAAAVVMGPSRRSILDRLEDDHDNLRAAMAWALETGAAETALRLGAALWRFWQMRGHLIEGLERLEKALALEHGDEHPAQRADALDAAAGVAYWLSDTDRSRALYLEEIELRRALGDRRGLAEAMYSVSFTWSIIGLQTERNADGAISYINDALEIFRELDDKSGIGRCQWALANVEWGTGRLREAIRNASEALEVFTAIDDTFMVGWSSYTLGIANLAIDHEEEGGDPESRREAARWFRRALDVFTETDDISGYTLVVDGFAVIATRDGDLERAARISGAVAQLERLSGTGLNLWNREVLEFDPEALRENPDLQEAWAEGAAMSTGEAVAYARAD